jgi:hypothetical protein
MQVSTQLLLVPMLSISFPTHTHGVMLNSDGSNNRSNSSSSNLNLCYSRNTDLDFEHITNIIFNMRMALCSRHKCDRSLES